MKTYMASIIAATLLFSCGKKVKDNDGHAAPPPSNTEIPRWEHVTHKNIKFDYYVTSNDDSFKMLDSSEDVSTITPTLKLKGPGDELMDFVMLFQPAAGETCKGYLSSKNWNGIVFDKSPADQVVYFMDSHKISETGKVLSYLYFLILKDDDSCVRLTFYDIEFHAYRHELSALDSSELAKTIRTIAGSVVINSK